MLLGALKVEEYERKPNNNYNLLAAGRLVSSLRGCAASRNFLRW